MKRAPILLSAAVLIALAAFLLMLRPQELNLSPTEGPAGQATQTVAPASSQSKDPVSSSVTPTQCLGEAFLQRPRTGMDEASLKAELQGLGEAELEEHWTNYVVQDGEHTLVWHMVKAEGPQGQERWSLKTFRDDEDGPTLLAEQMFPSKTLAQQALKEKLPPGSLEQRTRTWHYPHGVSVKHQLDDGLVSSFEITQGRSRYSCETNGCRCARL